jgi:hypothetical protein
MAKDLIFANKEDANQTVMEYCTVRGVYGIKYPHGETILHWAAAANNITICKFAIEKGIEVNLSNSRGTTALYYACMNKCNEAIEYLLSVGGDPLIRSGFSGILPLNMVTNENIRQLIQKKIDSMVYDVIDDMIVPRKDVNKTKIYLYRLYRLYVINLEEYFHYGEVRQEQKEIYLKEAHAIYAIGGISALSDKCNATRLMDQQYQNKCLYCMKDATKICGKCHAVKFCNVACQRSANFLHKFDCK